MDFDRFVSEVRGYLYSPPTEKKNGKRVSVKVTKLWLLNRDLFTVFCFGILGVYIGIALCYNYVVVPMVDSAKCASLTPVGDRYFDVEPNHICVYVDMSNNNIERYRIVVDPISNSWVLAYDIKYALGGGNK
jgi:hypothetical protein